MPLINRSLDAAVGRVSILWSMPVPPDRVWWGLTDPEALPQWMGALVSGRFVLGDVVRIQHAENCASTSKVLDCEPHALLAMTWDFPNEPLSHLSISLTPAGAGTELTLIHEDLGSEAPGYLPGWHTHLVYLEALLTGDPLPWSGFWPTHDRLR